MDFPKSVPSVGLVDGKFIDEDAIAGTPGSLIPSAWGNAVTQEILKVIQEAGLDPDEDDNTQLNAAIDQKIAEITLSFASQAEAEAGESTDKAMSPLRVFQAINKIVKQATEAALGLLKISTQAQVNAGTDDATAVTPKKLAAWFTAKFSQATEGATGLIAIATQAKTNAGTDDLTAITPKKFKEGLLTVLGFSPVQQGGGIGQSATAANKLYLGYSAALSRPSLTVDAVNYGGLAFLSDLVFTKEYVSSPQAFTRGGLITVPHGLGVNPKIITGTLICQTTENGWVAGDRQHIALVPDNDDAGVVVGFGCRADTVNVYARCGVTGPYGVNINTGATAGTAADANWRLEVRVYA